MAVARQDFSLSGPGIKRFESPERVFVFNQGRLEVITIGGRLIGKGSYGPGWRWSHTVKAQPRGSWEQRPEVVGVVLSGRVKLRVGEDREIDLTPGDFFHVASDYDSWVVGYRPCEVLYVSGVEALVDRLRREA